MSLRVFPEKISVSISRLRKADGLLQNGWAFSNLLRDWKEQKGRGRSDLHSLPAWMSRELRHLPWPLRFWFSGLQTRTGTYIIDSLLLRPSNGTTGFPETQLEDNRLWDFSASVIVWVSTLLVLFFIGLFSEEPWLI